MHMKNHPVDRRVVRLWLLREICLFLSGGISSDKFDEDALLGGTKSELIANDPTCYDVAYWFWFFYDDYKDQPWPELFDAGKEENRETVRIIGDILILLTSEFEFAGKRLPDDCFQSAFPAEAALSVPVRIGPQGGEGTVPPASGGICSEAHPPVRVRHLYRGGFP